MIRFLWELFKSLFFRSRWRLPEFVFRPGRLLHEQGLVMSTAFVGRPGAGKTVALANELLVQIKHHPEQSFFIFDWSGGLINTLLMLALSDEKRDEIIPRLIYDAMGGREIDGEVYVMPMPEFSEKYDPEKPWLERVEDQADRVQRTFEALNPNLVELNPTLGGRPIKSLFPNLLLLINAIRDDNGGPWQITEVTKLLNRKSGSLPESNSAAGLERPTSISPTILPAGRRLTRTWPRLGGCFGRHQVKANSWPGGLPKARVDAE
jgi:hypothetical protein